MESPKKNRILIKVGIALALMLLILFLKHFVEHKESSSSKSTHGAISFASSAHQKSNQIQDNASGDNAAESLDTLTAQLRMTKDRVKQLAKDNALIKNQNQQIIQKLQGGDSMQDAQLSQEIDQLKQEVHASSASGYKIGDGGVQDITTVPDLTGSIESRKTIYTQTGEQNQSSVVNNKKNEKKLIPYYTIPANATAVDDKLMSALVGRIPVKGVVTDPYPFKIVFANDTLASNGWRVPDLKQMVVSGYCEGDLNLLSVRGWVTSLTFTFNDGRIFTLSSNDNNIGHFTKQNALGYLSDTHGDPFFRGKLITNAPAYLTGNILLDAGAGAASAFAQSQTTNQTSALGGSSSTVTGSAEKYVLGQAMGNAAQGAQTWWQAREENSFDAIFVPAGQKVVINFAKQIDIDYNPKGRKVVYENRENRENQDTNNVEKNNVSRRID